MTVSRALSKLVLAGMEDKEALRSLREALIRTVGRNGQVDTLLKPGMVEADRLLSRAKLEEKYGVDGFRAVEILRR